MRLINLDEAKTEEALKAPRNTFCIYGPTGSGKTTFTSTFPRVVFLSETTESGYESLRGISSDMLFEPGVRPIVLGIEKMNDMMLAREALAPHIASGMVQTVAIDSLTFYADLYLNYLFAVYANNNGANLKAYGDLGRHLRDLRVKWHQMGCNVVSLCLPQDPDEDRPNGLPSIPGKESGKFGASCDFLLYMRSERFKKGEEYIDNFQMHSKPYGKYVARARRAVGQPEIPTPLVNTTYADFITQLGYDVEATRAALPAYQDPTQAIMAFINNASRAQGTAPPVTNAQPSVARPAAVPMKPHVPTAARAAVRPQPVSRPAVPPRR